MDSTRVQVNPDTCDFSTCNMILLSVNSLGLTPINPFPDVDLGKPHFGGFREIVVSKKHIYLYDCRSFRSYLLCIYLLFTANKMGKAKSKIDPYDPSVLIEYKSISIPGGMNRFICVPLKKKKKTMLAFSHK